MNVAQLYELDGFDTTASTVSQLHALGKYVVCYFSAGTLENWRPDASSFPASVIGSADAGWQGENYLDIRQTSVLEPIMTARIAMCKTKGFDAIDPDNIDEYENNSGFPLTASNQLTYNEFLATAAHQQNLAAAQKNDPGQVTQLVSFFDFSVTEECFPGKNCSQYSPYHQQGKLVVDVEYSNDAGGNAVSASQFTSSVCPQDKGTLGFEPILTDLNLDQTPTFCP